MTEEFLAILDREKEEELISFLKSIDDGQKKKISPAIKKLAKEFSQFGNIGGNTYGHINGTDKKRDMLQLASFVCFNQADYDKTPYSVWMLDKERLSRIIDWYCPVWFSDFVNKQASRGSLPYYLHYEWIMELTERGFLRPSRELLVNAMPQMIFEHGKNKYWEFKPENLLKFKITLEEHIWFLFELESNLHYSDRFLNFGDKISTEKIGWIFLFKQFSADKKLDRSRMLKESLLASNRNFNKVLSGWFSQLFMELEPSTAEVLNLQSELFSVLSSPHSKPVNTSLQAIKKIVAQEGFNASGFLDAVPVLLSGETKATIISTLAILEKIAQKDPACSSRIVSLVCQCFIQTDDELQSRAARIIEKYGDPVNAGLREELANFLPGMLTTARQALSRFYEPSEETEIKDTIISSGIDASDSHSGLSNIPFPETIDDLVFLASQAFDNNEPWHIDVLSAALVKFSTKLKEEDLPLFEPAFQRAFGLIKTNYRATLGYLDHLIALFFIDFGNFLIQKFPSGSETILKIYRKQDTKEGEKQASFLVTPAIGSYTAHWEPNSKASFYEPYQQLLTEALSMIKQGSGLPVLSTPTQEPCWISPPAFIHRLIQYQQAGHEPNEMDFQVAISRIGSYDRAEAMLLAKDKLSGELRELIIFLLEETAVPQKPFHYKAAWLVASLTRREKKIWPVFESFSFNKELLKNYTGQIQWKTIKEDNTFPRYDYALRKSVEVTETRKILSVQREYPVTETQGLKKMLTSLLSAPKKEVSNLYASMHFRVDFLSIEFNDVKRILSLVPHNPEPILADSINHCLKYSDFWGEEKKRMVTAVIQFLYEVWKTPGEMSYLFLGTCMLSGDKTIINIAGELWIRGVSMNNLNNVDLGKVIGRHESIEFAPLKRFTDLVTQHLIRVSDLHNQQLQVLVENILLLLPDEPIKNLKKLLEIYRELLAVNKSTVELPGVIPRLKVWKEAASLRKIINLISGV